MFTIIDSPSSYIWFLKIFCPNQSNTMMSKSYQIYLVSKIFEAKLSDQEFHFYIILYDNIFFAGPKYTHLQLNYKCICKGGKMNYYKKEFRFFLMFLVVPLLVDQFLFQMRRSFLFLCMYN